MDYTELKMLIKGLLCSHFPSSSTKLSQVIFELSRNDLLTIIDGIGTIPEDIEHDSTEEKLYTKVSDIVFAKALQEMGLQATVLTERADSADIIARSNYHGYSLIGDAKAFRLSRTAKNAKDFKVDATNNWRGSNDFAVLSCPYFQYPKNSSQIYQEALNKNVCLFSWEYLHIMLSLGIRETQEISFRDLWNQSEIIANTTTVGHSKKCFITQQNENFKKILNISDAQFKGLFDNIKTTLISRGQNEINFYRDEIEKVKTLTRNEAIRQLLRALKFESKIQTIDRFIAQLQSDTNENN